MTNTRVTTKDVYELIERHRIEQKKDLKDVKSEVVRVLDTHQKKIDKLEDGQAKMFGGIILIGIVWQWVINQFIK